MPNPNSTLASTPTSSEGTIRFAVIGDYGMDNADEARVATLVESWNPDFVITTGDNNYPDGEASTIDHRIGQYFSQYIGDYQGSYGPGSPTNRFWPSLGNHDWPAITCTGNSCSGAYLDYFTLPNNERYYDVDLGLVHLFAIDSDSREPDGRNESSIQANWLRDQLAASISCYNIVYFHHPAYSSGLHGSVSAMQWPFQVWGSDAVISGHDHLYERLDVNDIPYFVNGAGGAVLYSFTNIGNLPPEATSIVRYNQDHGAMLITATSTGITYQFYNADGILIDDYTVSKDCAKSIPKVTITRPTNGSTFNEGDSISFTGLASDFEDGDLTASLIWTSNVDGAIGSGGSSSRSDLSVGIHTVTATVMDSDGRTASATVTITVFASGAPVLVGAGNIANDKLDSEQTAKLLETIPGTVFTLGDNAYPDGSYADFMAYYEPTWGRHKVRTHPSPGEYDYNTPGASGYYTYFGAAAGDPAKGYYSYDVADWHIVVLNSQCSRIGGCGSQDPQGKWLQADLAANPRTCTLAYWHSPLFSSGGGDLKVQDFWSILYNAGADVVLNGHVHSYERFALQDPTGAADPVYGIREFVVGTGGGGLSSLPSTSSPNSEAKNDETYGVLKLTLHPGSYDWEFIPAAGEVFTDSGSATCVTPAPPNSPPVAKDDSASTPENTVVTIDVTTNDSDPDGNLDPSTTNTTCVNGSTGCANPSNGSLINNGDGTFIYSSNLDFNGVDSFVYEVCDTEFLCDTATVSITVVESQGLWLPFILR